MDILFRKRIANPRCSYSTIVNTRSRKYPRSSQKVVDPIRQTTRYNMAQVVCFAGSQSITARLLVHGGPAPSPRLHCGPLHPSVLPSTHGVQ
jgi:hypothetical protein